MNSTDLHQTQTVNETKTRTTVLFVDDEDNILRSLKRLFMDDDFDVITASSGEEGLGVLKGNLDIFLIVSDQRMPGMKGSQFLEKAKKLTPYAQRILLTGYADINAAVDVINKGGVHKYITKPWEDEELVRIVREAAQRYNLIKENKRLTAIVKQQNAELKEWTSKLELLVRKQTTDIQNKSDKLEEMNGELKKDFENLIAAFSGLLELRDQGSGRHSKNVADISASVAKAMKLSYEEVEAITVASLLHDIGKIGMPDILLLKNINNMNSSERNEYMLHPMRGQMALESIEHLEKPSIIIRHHHEDYNGMGFPDSLSGEEIPIGSRIIAMSDFFDRTLRTIRGGDSIRLALREVRKEVNRKFDPDIFPSLETIITDIQKRVLARIYASEEVEMELHPGDLQIGMTVAKDVKTGALIMTKGKVLTNHTIQILKHHYKINPTQSGIFVKIKKQ